MAWPLKFKALLEIEKNDIPKPSHVWATYCVCACSKSACGWGGWMLEAIFSNPKAKQGEDLLPSPSELLCPECGMPLFRTRASYRFDRSKNQRPPGGVAGIDYEVLPMKYTKK
jgi:hypothetical protein